VKVAVNIEWVIEGLVFVSVDETLRRGEEALECLRHAVYDAMVKKAALSQFAIINRNNKPYKIKASKAVRMIEEGRIQRGERPYAKEPQIVK